MEYKKPQDYLHNTEQRYNYRIYFFLCCPCILCRNSSISTMYYESRLNQKRKGSKLANEKHVLPSTNTCLPTRTCCELILYMLHDFIHYTTKWNGKGAHTNRNRIFLCYYRYCIHKLGNLLFPSFVITWGTITIALNIIQIIFKRLLVYWSYKATFPI